MPSSSFRSFKFNLIDVDRLCQAHAIISNGAQGKKSLGHITRSGVVMLCAAWEHYAENLIIESVKYLCEHATTPYSLPINVQKEISKAVRESKHELRPLHLSGDGWRQVYIDHATTLLASLNTPKSGKLNEHYNRLIGVAKISAAWSLNEITLDDFVTARGNIAHHGRQANYVTIVELNAFRNQIRQYAVDTDNYIANYLRQSAHQAHKPWRVTT